jgi:hypothetical protein
MTQLVGGLALGSFAVGGMVGAFGFSGLVMTGLSAFGAPFLGALVFSWWRQFKTKRHARVERRQPRGGQP